MQKSSVRFNLKYFNLIPYLFLLASTLALFGCSKYKIINEDNFVKIYSDLIIARDTSNQAGITLMQVKKIIFKKYGISEGDYKATVDYYNSDPKKWESVFDKSIAYVNTLKNRKSH